MQDAKKEQTTKVMQSKQKALLALMPRLLPTMLVAVLHRLPFVAVGIGLQAYLQHPSVVSSTGEILNAQGVMWVMMLAVFVQWLLSVPLDFGLYRYLTLLAKGEKASPLTVLDAFGSGKDMRASLGLAFAIGVRALFWMGIPSVLYVGSAFLVSEGFAYYDIITGVYFAVIGIAYVKMRAYAGGYMLWFQNPKMRTWAAVKQANTLFRGKFCYIFLLEISFLLWFLLGAITCGVLLLFVMVYEALAFIYYLDAQCGVLGAKEETHENEW